MALPFHCPLRGLRVARPPELGRARFVLRPQWGALSKRRAAALARRV